MLQGSYLGFSKLIFFGQTIKV